jgi:hypothetical protein
MSTPAPAAAAAAALTNLLLQQAPLEPLRLVLDSCSIQPIDVALTTALLLPCPLSEA